MIAMKVEPKFAEPITETWVDLKARVKNLSTGISLFQRPDGAGPSLADN